MPLPELNGALLVKVWNSGPDLRPVVDRVLAGATQAERARERARFIHLAGVLTGGPRRTLAKRLWVRMRELVRHAAWLAIDVTNPDGALRAALLIDGWEVVSRPTVCRAVQFKDTQP